MRPSSTRRATASQSLSAKSSRLCTQGVRRPNSAAMVAGPSPSSRRSDATTRASSMAVTVLGGALARSSARLASGALRACSTTAGTTSEPAAFQRARRLKPSTTS